MANFSLFETFFFLTLAITFILILLLIYHFKDRLSKLEQKSDSMFEIIQNLHGTFNDELTKLKASGGNNQVILGPTLDPYVVPQNETLNLIEEEFDIKKIENIDLVIDKNDEEAEDESIEEDSDEEEDESIEEDSDEDEDEDEIVQSDTETTIEKIDVPSMSNIEIKDYKKMNVTELRSLVSSKGLSATPNKLKKNELIDLLSQ